MKMPSSTSSMSLLLVLVVMLLLTISLLASAEVIPLYVSSQLSSLASSLIDKSKNDKKKSAIDLKPISDVNQFWRDSVGSAMVDTIRPRSSFPASDFFQAKQHNIPMPVAFTPVCVAVNVKSHSASLALPSETQMQAVTVNQLAAWLTGNSSILTAAGESSHPLLSVSRAAVSKTSALGAVVADALRNLAVYFPPETAISGATGSRESVWPGATVASGNVQWYDSDELVEEGLRTATPLSGQALIGFVLHASPLALARPANDIRCLPVKMQKDQVTAANASNVDPSLLTVQYNPSEARHELAFTARLRYPSAVLSSSSSMNVVVYPFLALAAIMTDSRTFKCGARAVAIQDLFFNVSFADSRSGLLLLVSSSSSSSSSYYSYAQALRSAGGALQPSWPWYLPDAKTRNLIRRILFVDLNGLVQCNGGADDAAKLFNGRALGSVSIAAASSDVIEAMSSLAEAFVIDTLAHPLQGVTFTAAMFSTAVTSGRISNVFERPGLVVFEETRRDGTLLAVYQDAAFSGGDSSSQQQQKASNHPTIVAAFGTGFSSAPSFFAPLTAPASATTTTSSSFNSLLAVPLALSGTCLAYNPRALSASMSTTSTVQLPNRLRFPVCLIVELLVAASTTTVAWNDHRIQQLSSHRTSSTTLEFLPPSPIQLLTVNRDSNFFQSPEFRRTIIMATNHCSSSAFFSASSSLSAASAFTTASDAPSSAVSVSDEALISTLLSTPGAMTMLPCSRAAGLFEAESLYLGFLDIDGQLLSDAVADDGGGGSPSDLLYLLGSQRRRVIDSHRSFSGGASGVRELSVKSNPARASSYAVGDALQQHGYGSSPAVFSTMTVWLSTAPIRAAVVSSSSSSSSNNNAAAGTSSRQNCTQLFGAARFVEWLLSTGMGLDAESLAAATLDVLSSHSTAVPLLASISAAHHFALFEQDLLGSVLGDNFLANALASVQCVDATTGQVLQHYRAFPPTPAEKDPAASLTFAIGFPMALLLAICIFIALVYALRRRESDDTRFAPVDATKPIAIICTHIPLKEHLRIRVGTEALDKWLELYREQVRVCAEKAQVYVIKEGEHSGFFLAARSSDSALDFAFMLHEQLLQLSPLELSGEMNDELRKAYDALAGPFQRGIAHPAPLRTTGGAASNPVQQRRQSVNAVREVPADVASPSAAGAALKANSTWFESLGAMIMDSAVGEYRHRTAAEGDGLSVVPDSEKEKLFLGILCSVGIDMGRVDVHFAKGKELGDAAGYDYSGIPVEHADSLALVASPGETLVSEDLLRGVSRYFDAKRVGRVVCVGEVDLGVPLPVRDFEFDDDDDSSSNSSRSTSDTGGEDAVAVGDIDDIVLDDLGALVARSKKKQQQQQQGRRRSSSKQIKQQKLLLEKRRAAAGVTERVLVDDLRSEFRKYNPRFVEEEEQEDIRNASRTRLPQPAAAAAPAPVSVGGAAATTTTTSAVSPSLSPSQSGVVAVVGSGAITFHLSDVEHVQSGEFPNNAGDLEHNSSVVVPAPAMRKSTAGPASSDEGMSSESRQRRRAGGIAADFDDDDDDSGPPADAAKELNLNKQQQHTHRRSSTKEHLDEEEEEDSKNASGATEAEDGTDKNSNTLTAGGKLGARKPSVIDLFVPIPSADSVANPEEGPTSSSSAAVVYTESPEVRPVVAAAGAVVGESSLSLPPSSAKPAATAAADPDVAPIGMAVAITSAGESDNNSNVRASSVDSLNQSESTAAGGGHTNSPGISPTKAAAAASGGRRNSNKNNNRRGGGAARSTESGSTPQEERNPFSMLLGQSANNASGLLPTTNSAATNTTTTSSKIRIPPPPPLEAERLRGIWLQQQQQGGGSKRRRSLADRRILGDDGKEGGEPSSPSSPGATMKTGDNKYTNEKERQQHAIKRYEMRPTLVFSVLPRSLRHRVFPPPRDIHDAKDRTLTEPISKLLAELLYKQDIDALARSKIAGEKQRKLMKLPRYHYEIVQDPYSASGSPAGSFRFNNSNRREMLQQQHQQHTLSMQQRQQEQDEEEQRAINAFNFPRSPSETPPGGNNSVTPPTPGLITSSSNVFELVPSLPNSPANNNNNNNKPQKQLQRRDSLRIAKPLPPPPPPAPRAVATVNAAPPSTSAVVVSAPPIPARLQRAPVPIEKRPAWGAPAPSAAAASTTSSPAKVDGASVWGTRRRAF